VQRQAGDVHLAQRRLHVSHRVPHRALLAVRLALQLEEGLGVVAVHPSGQRLRHCEALQRVPHLAPLHAVDNEVGGLVHLVDGTEHALLHETLVFLKGLQQAVLLVQQLGQLVQCLQVQLHIKSCVVGRHTGRARREQDLAKPRARAT
jgi:hypothetical protein